MNETDLRQAANELDRSSNGSQALWAVLAWLEEDALSIR